MNIRLENLREIKTEYLKNFKLKDSLTEVELYGLELITAKLMLDINEDLGIESNMNECVDLIDRYTVHREDCLDVLDGVYDVLYMGNIKLLSVHLTINGIVLFKCLKDEYEYYTDDNETFFMSL